MRFDEEGRGYPLSESANTVLDAYRRALQKTGRKSKRQHSSRKYRNKKTFSRFPVASIITERTCFRDGQQRGIRIRFHGRSFGLCKRQKVHAVACAAFNRHDVHQRAERRQGKGKGRLNR